MNPRTETVYPLVLLLALTCAGAPRALQAMTVELPVALDYRIIEQSLAEQVFTGPGTTAPVFSDRLGCNSLVLSAPRVEGTDTGRVRVLIAMQARTGTPLAGKCRFARTWNGLVETEQLAYVEPGTAMVQFRIVESRLRRSEGGKDILPRFMQRWIRDYVHPRLARVRIDLAPAVTGIGDLLDAALSPPADAAPLAPAVSLVAVQPTPDALVAQLSLTLADAPPAAVAPTQAAPLTAHELAEWDAHWQAWDAFTTWMIKTLAEPAGPELTRELATTLLEARYELRDALARDDRSRDPVRELFLNTWSRLAPLLHDADLPLPGREALQFAVFISAGDALQTLDRLAPHLGLRLDRNALRQFARMLEPGVDEQALQYDTAVDPQLRALLGLAPEFDAEPPQGLSVLSWFIPSAQAAQIDPQLVEHLNRWVPKRPEIDRYLDAMARLLDAIADAEHDKGKVPPTFLPVYDPLLRATAWQESCWRQYVERDGELEPIRSAAGSVGLMQVNMHVWRGVYDSEEILGDVGYNARAGNEILVHYLVDYAIRKNEHEVTGSPDNLARAAYAMYNGGPRHLRRYREAGTSASLQKIDTAFWAKYQAIQNQGPSAVKQCLAG